MLQWADDELGVSVCTLGEEGSSEIRKGKTFLVRLQSAHPLLHTEDPVRLIISGNSYLERATVKEWRRAKTS